MNPNSWMSQSPPPPYNSLVGPSRDTLHFLDGHYANSSHGANEFENTPDVGILHPTQSYRYLPGKVEYDPLARGPQYDCTASIEPTGYDGDAVPAIMAFADQYLQHSPRSSGLSWPADGDNSDTSHAVHWAAKRENMGDVRSFSPPFQCCWPSSQLRKDSPRQIPPYDSTTILERNVLPAPAFITFEIPQITPEPRPQTVKFADGRKPRQALACLFCRRRKIPCGRPAAEAADQTCKQCARRDRECVYPTESRRGHHSRVKGNPRQT
ncbi:hypothetical protein MSAN_00469300 [Mycena sanguinolenta]|uniref:Zn(2)-C6 fungal-type domain-containing protein n=1 Tax=Mycena sanguinolenta TaxID=230812 RepID=A0A8H6ZF87_9AGAR|nr:hypothetical protein MSAN_00469300 [Mycena sanguinolenta]